MFFLFHGDDQYSKRKFLAKQMAKLGEPDMVSLNTMRLEGKGLTLSQIEAACGAMPFLAPKRVVIINGLLGSKPPKELVKELVKWLPGMPETTNLILLELKGIKASNALVKLAAKDKKVGYVKAFERPQGRDLEKWIVAAVNERGGTIAPRAVNALAVNVGNDLEAMANEIEKLVLYKGEEQIRVEDVERLSPYSAESSIFNLVDALGTRNGKMAMSLLHEQMVAGTDPFYLFSMIIRQFRLLIQVKACVEEKLRPPEIATAVGMHPFVAKKMVQQVRNFSMGQLKQIYNHLMMIDVGVKTGKMEMTTALNLFVATLTR